MDGWMDGWMEEYVRLKHMLLNSTAYTQAAIETLFCDKHTHYLSLFLSLSPPPPLATPYTYMHA